MVTIHFKRRYTTTCIKQGRQHNNAAQRTRVKKICKSKKVKQNNVYDTDMKKSHSKARTSITIYLRLSKINKGYL